MVRPAGATRARGIERWPLVLIAAAAIVIWAAFQFDDSTIKWASSHQEWSMRRFAGSLSHYGDWPFLMAGALPLAWMFHRYGRRRWARLVCIMMVSSSISGTVVNAVRLSTGRTRPNAKAPSGWYGLWHEGRWLVGSNKFNSFPSGHTATAVGFVVPLLLAAPRLGIPALLLAFMIAGSRLYLGVHHLSDVTAAAVVAAWVGVETSRRWPAPPKDPESATRSQGS